MVFTGGTLYGGDSQNVSVDTINTGTGAATVGAGETPGTVFYGLAPSAVPEPGTLTLLGAGLVALSIARRRAIR